MQCKESSSTTEMLANISRLNLDPLLKLCQILTNANANVNVRGIKYSWIAQMSSQRQQCGHFYFREHCQDFPQTTLTFHALELLVLGGEVGYVAWRQRTQKLNTDNPGDTLALVLTSAEHCSLLWYWHLHWHWNWNWHFNIIWAVFRWKVIYMLHQLGKPSRKKSQVSMDTFRRGGEGSTPFHSFWGCFY